MPRKRNRKEPEPNRPIVPPSDRVVEPGAMADRGVPNEPVVVKKHKTVFHRQNVIQFMNPYPLADIADQEAMKKLTESKIRRDLFIQGFAKLKSKPTDDPLSFYRIAGIHGLPYEPYDEPLGPPVRVSPDRWDGYCEHGSVLFPTWHRAYMLLIEQAIIGCAREVVEEHVQVVSPDVIELCRAQVDNIRFPYWDWGSTHSQTYGLPACLTLETLYVEFPVANQSFLNPFRGFVLPLEMKSPLFDYSLPEMIPSSKPKYNPHLVDTPFTPSHYSTVRYPTPEYVSDYVALKDVFSTQVPVLLRPSVYAMFNEELWSRFSNHHDDTTDADEQSKEITVKHSLEFVHDQVHDLTGGPGGHMAYLDVAAFDPLFFFHHLNVDRLCALWQAAHPEQQSWIKEGGTSPGGTRMKPPGTKEDENSSLYPFRKEVVPTEEFWTSVGVRYVTDLGYTYPELEDIENLRDISPEKAKDIEHKMRIFYFPMQFEESRVYLTVGGVDKFAFQGPYHILIYVGKTDKDVLDKVVTKGSSYFVMSVAIFSRGKTNKCGRCQNSIAQGKRMKFTVDLTTALFTLDIKVSDLTPDKLPTAIVAETARGELHELKDITRHVSVCKTDKENSDIVYMARTRFH